MIELPNLTLKIKGNLIISITNRELLCFTDTFLVVRRRFSLAQTDSLLMRMRSVASDELNQMMQRRMSQENPIRASETEFAQRLQKLVVLAVNRLIYHGTTLILPFYLLYCSLYSLHLTRAESEHAH